jgi:hypothetical protein
MIRSPRAFLAMLTAGFLLAVTSLPGNAQQAVFPNEGSVGLVPPTGMSEIPGVAGFEDRVAQAAILIMEVPPAAVGEVSKSFTADALETKGVTIEDRQDVTLPNGAKGVLLTGYQSMGTAALKKWIMLVGTGNQAAMVTVQFPEAASARYSDAVVKAALDSVAFRAPPTQEELLARLPFTIGSAEGFRVVRVLGANAALLVKGPEGGDDLAGHPFFIVAAAPGDIREDERERLAKRAISSVPGVKELRVERGGPLRINGQPGFELVGNAVEVQSGKPVKVAQWLRFGRSGYLRMVGVAPADEFDAAFTSMRALRDGIETR